MLVPFVLIECPSLPQLMYRALRLTPLPHACFYTWTSYFAPVASLFDPELIPPWVFISKQPIFAWGFIMLRVFSFVPNSACFFKNSSLYVELYYLILSIY